MICKAFTYKAMAWLSAALIMISGETGMASSLRLEEPSVFAGQWQATLSERSDDAKAQKHQDKPSNTCIVELQANKTLSKGADCLGAWLEATPIGWFPIRTACRSPARKVQESSFSVDNVTGFIRRL